MRAYGCVHTDAYRVGRSARGAAMLDPFSHPPASASWLRARIHSPLLSMGMSNCTDLCGVNGTGMGWGSGTHFTLATAANEEDATVASDLEGEPRPASER